MPLPKWIKGFFDKLLKKISRPKTPRKALGDAGENAAAKFLKGRGMRIVKRNYRSGRDEIDIIAADAGTLVFVEVKTRSANALVPGYFAAVQKRKKAAIRRCAKAYMSALPRAPKSFRYDVVEVRFGAEAESSAGKSGPDILHYENVRF